MSVRGRLGPVARSVLRCVPNAGDDSVSTDEVAARLGMKRDTVSKTLERLVRRGVVVRLRKGAYQLAPAFGAEQRTVITRNAARVDEHVAAVAAYVKAGGR